MQTACIFFQTYHLDRITCRSAAILHAMFPWNIIQSSTTISTSYLPLDLPCLSTKRNNQSRLNQAEVHIKKKYYGLITEHLQLKPMTSDWLFTALDFPCLSAKRNNQSRLNQAKVHIKKKYYGLITEHLQLKPMTSDWLFTAQEESLLCSQEPVMWHYVSQMNPVHSLSSYSSIPILMLCQHLGLPNGLFPSGFQTKTCMHVTSPYTCHMPLPSHPPRFISSQIIGV